MRLNTASTAMTIRRPGGTIRANGAPGATIRVGNPDERPGTRRLLGNPEERLVRRYLGNPEERYGTITRPGGTITAPPVPDQRWGGTITRGGTITSPILGNPEEKLRQLILQGAAGIGFGATDAEIEAMADALAKKPNLTPFDVASAMSALSASDRQLLGQKLIAKGVPPGDVSYGIEHAEGSKPLPPIKISPVYSVLATVSMAASAYHGYKRNRSIGWALAWGFLGALFPIITPTIALAQGFGKPKGAG